MRGGRRGTPLTAVGEDPGEIGNPQTDQVGRGWERPVALDDVVSDLPDTPQAPGWEWGFRLELISTRAPARRLHRLLYRLFRRRRCTNAPRNSATARQMTRSEQRAIYAE